MQTIQSKPYQTILDNAQTISALAQRKFLLVKISVTSGRTQQNYRECVESIDNALQQIFDYDYRGAPDENRIDDLLSFWNEIDARM